MLFHSRSTNTLSRQQPRPSMLMAMPCRRSVSVNSRLVNWAALVGVHDLGLAMPGDGFLQGGHAEVGLHGDRHAVGKHASATTYREELAVVRIMVASRQGRVRIGGVHPLQHPSHRRSPYDGDIDHPL